MFPVLPPGGGVDPGPARVAPTPAVGATQPVVGVGPMMPVDPQNPRAAALPVNTDAADAARLKAELARGGVVGSSGAAAQEVLPALRALPNNRAAAVAPQLTQLLQLLQALGVTEGGEGAPPVVNWPEAGQPVADEPASALLRLREALGQSALFAANPRTPQALAALAQSPWGGTGPMASTAAAGLPAPGAALAAPEAAEAPATALLPLAHEAAAPAAAMAATALAQPAERAQQALQLLLHGQLQWRGELTPGVPLQLEREDLWQEDPAQPGRLLPGTALRLELLLPGTGPLVVLAQQVAGQMTVRLLPAAPHAARFEAALADLQTALAPLANPPVDLALQARGANPA
ncbi:MAG: hypothetical protein QUV35_07210 [Hydrogenophaga sp.]|uniref:hypothetical protein n=1 Tax=Hydrogenophaga sp. TaxID=1904254 RepID=UPI00263084E8|nr:hypothetical protein [Hydrogenophaga sp.]MDM7942400.1 hypothetical protein [Hydrogenophaga sp.]